MLKQYVQYQKPNARMLQALSLPLLAGVYYFGLRVLVTVTVCCLVCWATEYLFTRKQGKPASMAAFVTGALLALALPPMIPFWMAAVGSAFTIVFAKMSFGGFGKNVFNPALVGRCFLYICFPAALAATWHHPVTSPGPPWKSPEAAEIREEREPAGFPGGFVRYSPAPDATTAATPLTYNKRLNQDARKALSVGNRALYEEKVETLRSYDFTRLLLGNISGSAGETCALAVLLALAYLIWRKTVQIPLVVAPLAGFLGCSVLLWLTGVITLPLGTTLIVGVIGGGGLFGVTFMTTEPVTAPMRSESKWIYGVLIGCFAAIIRTMSSFNAGWMFSILLGNMFGPVIDIAVDAVKNARKARASKTEGDG